MPDPFFLSTRNETNHQSQLYLITSNSTRTFGLVSYPDFATREEADIIFFNLKVYYF